MLRIAVLGGGHGALAAAGDLAHRGFQVTLALRSRPRFAQLFETSRVRLTGAIEGCGDLAAVTDDHAAAAAGGGLRGHIRAAAPGAGVRRMGERGAAAGRVDPGERPISDRTLDLFVAGTPADVAKGVGRLVDAGATTITFSERLGDDPLWAIRVLGGIVSEATHRL